MKKKIITLMLLCFIGIGSINSASAATWAPHHHHHHHMHHHHHGHM